MELKDHKVIIRQLNEVNAADWDTTDRTPTGVAELWLKSPDETYLTNPLLKCWKCGLVSGTGLHQWDAKTITLSPSLLCGFCKVHYYIRNGMVVLA